MSDTTRDVNRFTDLLHNQGDDIDVNDDEDIDFDKYFTNFDNNQEEADSTDIPWITTTTTGVKRPAITPTATTAITTVEKKFKGIGEGEVKLPEYLSSSNTIFEEYIKSKVTNADNIMEDLREMAFYEHQIQIIALDARLWNAYLQSGLAELKVPEAEDNRSILQQIQCPRPTLPCIWPKKLKATIEADTSVPAADKALMSAKICYDYVNKRLAQYEEKTQSLQTKIQEKREQLQDNINDELEQHIAKLVEDYGVALYRIINEGYIAAVEFNYSERIVEDEFAHEQEFKEFSNEFQALIKSRIAAEAAKMDMELLKARVIHQQISPIFTTFQLPPPSNLDSIQDSTIRQRLTNRYEQLLQRTKSEMMLIHIQTAEMKMHELFKEFHNIQKEFFVKLRASHASKPMKDRINSFIDRRYKLIQRRLQTLLDLKVRFFVKAPTVKRQ